MQQKDPLSDLKQNQRIRVFFLLKTFKNIQLNLIFTSRNVSHCGLGCIVQPMHKEVATPMSNIDRLNRFCTSEAQGGKKTSQNFPLERKRNKFENFAQLHESYRSP